MSESRPGAIPFGEDWMRFALRKDPARRLAFFDTFLKMAQGWVPGEDATDDELDDYDRMCRLLADYVNGKKGGRPKKAEITSETPSETPTKTPDKTPTQTKKERKKEGKKDSSARMRAGKTPPTIEQFEGMAGVAGVPVEFARQLHAELDASGWIGADGLPVRNAMIFLKSAWNSQKKFSAARETSAGIDAVSIATNGACRADGTFACPGIDD